MSYTAEQYLDFFAPQYAASPNKEMAIQVATQRTNPRVFGDNTSMAIALRAAHLLAVGSAAAATGGTGGQISSKSEGDLSVSYFKDDSSSDMGDLNSTSYGKQLIGLINGTIPAIGVTGGNDDGVEDTREWDCEV